MIPVYFTHKILLLPTKFQVYNSYGDKSNDNLLQYYGFVELDNPHGTHSHSEKSHLL
jgi:hypothetical protein